MKNIKSRLPALMFLTATVLFTTTSCSKKIYDNTMEVKKTKNTSKNNKVTDPILLAEIEATKAGKAVLETGRKMALEDKTIIKGSCWNYVNEVFKRAGYGTNKKVVYKSKKSGPYVDVSKIQPGDWIYYVNYSYGGVEHSGIFVYWKDYKNKIGVTLSYGGEKRKEPGRYLPYNLKSVYYITRPGVD